MVDRAKGLTRGPMWVAAAAIALVAVAWGAQQPPPVEPHKGSGPASGKKEVRMDLGNPKTALLVVDIQNDYFKGGVLPLAGSDDAAERARQVIDAFRATGHPVIHIRHESKGPGLFAPESEGVKIENRVQPLPGEAVFTKHEVSSFEGTPLLDHLRKEHIERLVIVGMQTDVCVLGAVKGANEHGLETIVLTDATAAVSEERREKTLPTLAGHSARLMTVKDFLKAINR
jgi:nicotinamidase-related amidase